MRPLPCLLVSLLLAALWGGCIDLDEPANRPLAGDDGRELGRSVRLVRVADGLEAPVFVTAPGGDRLYVVEQVGRVRVVSGHLSEEGHALGTVAERPFLDLSDRVRSGGEQGLLGLAFHPDWPDDRRVFVDYTDRAGDSVLAVFEADDNETVDEASEQVLLRVPQPYSNHNGGMLAFGPDGMLYWSLGDGGSGGDPHGHGQDPDSLLGSILRLDVDRAEGYGIPADNPFADGKGGRPEVWMYGLRNPWRFSFDGDTMWIADVGQNRYEEVSRVPRAAQAGANLGWNAYEGDKVFDPSIAADLDEEPIMPVATYTRSAPHCSVTGGYVYTGSISALRDHYVFADFCSGWVWALVEDGAEETGWRMGMLFESGRRISSFGVDADGELYLVDHDGAVLIFLPR